MVGFRKNPKLTTRYVEIPLKKSVFLHSPISTRNGIEENLARILIGRYDDPEFGTIEAAGFFNFSPPIQNVILQPTAVFQSLELQLKFDYYAYGTIDDASQQVQVFELIDKVGSEGDFYNTTVLDAAPIPIGDKTFSLDPVEMQEGWANYIDTNPSNNKYFTLTIPLSGNLGPDLFQDLVDNATIFFDFDGFFHKYPGLSVKVPQGNKILGITPVYTLPFPSDVDSKLILRYTDGGESASVDFPIYYGSTVNGFIPVNSFSSISSDRSATPLNGLIPFQDFLPSDGRLFVQSGTGILTKLDLENFYKYVDTLENAIINSAELVLTNTSLERPPQQLEMRILGATNQFRSIYHDTIINGVLERLNDPYLLKIQSGIFVEGVGQELTSPTSVGILNDVTGASLSVNQTTGKIGATIITEFCQQIYLHKKDPRRIKAFSIYPVDDEFGKTVSSLILDPSSASLRIYYSKPTTSIQ